MPKSLSLWLVNLYVLAIGLPSSSHLPRQHIHGERASNERK
jgi:hypothetical protein